MLVDWVMYALLILANYLGGVGGGGEGDAVWLFRQVLSEGGQDTGVEPSSQTDPYWQAKPAGKMI
jgi:hypothetical protein